MNTTTPATPTRRSRTNESDHSDFSSLLATISEKWNLQLAAPEPNDSPRNRKSRSNTELKEIAAVCVARLKFLYFKNAYKKPLENFNAAAWKETNSWTYKPDADLDTLPTGVVGYLSQAQRAKLLCLLKDELEPAFIKIQKEQAAKALERSKRSDVEPVLYPPILERHMPQQLSKGSPEPVTHPQNPKRNSSGESDSVSKKSRKGGEEYSVFGKIDDVPVTTRKTPDSKLSSKRHQGLKSSSSNLLQKFAATKSQGLQEATSFSGTDSSHSSSLFAASSTEVKFRGGGLASANTSYSSSMGKGSGDSKIRMKDTPDSFSSTSFSQFDDLGPEYFPSTATLMANTPISAEEKIKARLHGVFPGLPRCLEKAPLGIRYEIIRIFLYTGIPLSHLDEQQIPDFSDLRIYETLWHWLKSVPALSGKPFPPKSDASAWEMTFSNFERGFKRAVMSGVLHLSESDEGPMFTFRLNPLHVELSHRLGRRFGNDRFIEFAIPVLDSKKLPKKVAQLMKLAGKSGRGKVTEWLHQGVHEFLGRTWGLFYIKDRSRKKSKGTADDEDAELLTMKRICLFATSGIDFEKRTKVAPEREPVDSHSEMTVKAMLDWLLSLESNGKQSFLKLYSRISLGLSTTYATYTLRAEQIIKRPEDICSKKIGNSKKTGEVMNDGCGRMSMALARNISEKLGLTTVPSAFQGRIGEAKGLWIVDYYNELSNGKPDQVVIETYPSQRKWKRTESRLPFSGDGDQRTFEVIKWSSPLKPAALTLQFLPLLEERGVPRVAISELLINGLNYEMCQMIVAIDNPHSFRKWLREHHPSVSERLKTGTVEFQGGKPKSMEETLNMLLDAGFDAKKFGYARELARKAFKQNCDVLKEKLNIRVGLSTYAYIAVDFQGVLAPNEIHLCFSNAFRDEMTGKSILELDNMDVLIARSPAHFVSDIQKVRAVFKPQLMGYKDVVMLPRTGDKPLASLLSGGDYDGDTVWLCFDQTIVQDFQNHDHVVGPNLEKKLSGEGPFLRKDKRTYSEITASGPDPFVQFMQESFDFNFRMSYLGICTNFKEQLCYEQNNVSSTSAELLSSLLSSLVDQSKQGFIFEEEDWARLRSYLSKTKVKRARASAMHVKDYLKKVAEETTEKALQDYHKALPAAEYFDQDLVKCANDFRALAQKSSAHRVLLDQLERDIEALKRTWGAEMHRTSRSQEETKAERAAFRRALMASYDTWQDIQPVGENSLKEQLLQKSWVHPENSHWALLKASVLFASHVRGNTNSKGWAMSPLPWFMACRQLCQLKTMATGSYNAVIPSMYAMLKPDAQFVKMIQSEALDPKFQEAKRDVEELLDGDEEHEEEDEERQYWG